MAVKETVVVEDEAADNGGDSVDAEGADEVPAGRAVGVAIQCVAGQVVKRRAGVGENREAVLAVGQCRCQSKIDLDGTRHVLRGE